MQMPSFIRASLKARAPKIIILIVSQLALYGLFLLFRPWRSYIGDTGLISSQAIFFQSSVVILLSALAAYIFFIRRHWPEKIGFKTLAAIWIGLNLLLFLVWPITSSDIFSYVYQGRVGSAHAANPYLSSYSFFPGDALFPILNNRWSDRTAPYNPLFVLISMGLTAVAGDNFLLAIILFKLLMVSASLLSGWLIYKISGSRTAFFIYAFNPLVLFEFALNGHNDVLVIFFLLMGLYLWLKQKTNTAWLSWLLAGLIKATGWLWLPLAVAIGIIQAKGRSTGWRRAGLWIISGLILYLAFYSLFFKSIGAFMDKTGSLFDVAGSNSLGIIMFAGILKLFYFPDPWYYAAILGKISFIILYGYIIFRILRVKTLQRDVQTLHCNVSTNAIAYAAFFLLFFTWLMPWYFTILVPLAALGYWQDKKSYWLYGLYFFTFYGIIYYMLLR
jgi:alpha-1,6-mannosyltransferase